MSALTVPFNIMLEVLVQKKIKAQWLTDRKGRNKTISIGRCYNRSCKKLRNLQKRKGLTNKFSNVTEYKLNTQKSITFSYPNRHTETKIYSSEPFIIGPK